MPSPTAAAAVDLNDLLVFAAVAEAGGFTAAADRLGRPKANVSLQVRRLEKALGVQLLHRTTRRVALTEPGAALMAGSIAPLRGALEALDRMPQAGTALTGTLRIACTVDHAAQSLARDVAAFAALHPQLQVDLRASDRVSDLVRDGIDVALRMGWLKDSSLRAVRLGSFRQLVVAAPAYLRKAGTPSHPRDLAQHQWVALTLLPTPLTWKFTGPGRATATVRMTARIRTDNPSSLRALLEAGAGISVLGEGTAREALQTGRLVQVLPRWKLPEGGLHAVFPPGRHQPRQVQAFMDFYRARLAQAEAA